MQYWYRLSPAAAGSACGVEGNDGDYQDVIDANLILEDGIFFSALLMSAAEVQVQIGDGPVVVWEGAAGINRKCSSFSFLLLDVGMFGFLFWGS